MIYGFDGIGRPVSVSSQFRNTRQVLIPAPARSPFDGSGNRQSIRFSSGVLEEWTHHPGLARLDGHRFTPKGDPPVEWRFSYDGEGRLAGTGEWSVALDSLGRLETADQAWDIGPGGSPQRLRMQTGFDAFDNLLTKTYFGSQVPTGELNAFELGGALRRNHLPATTGSKASQGGGWINAIHNPFGALESVATAVSSRRRLEMTWDPLGGLRRVEQVPDGPALAFQQTAQGLKVVETRPVGEVATEGILTYQEGNHLLSIEDRTAGSYADLIYLDGRLIAEGRGDKLIFCHLDHLGTPRFMTDLGGRIVGRLHLGPYGECLNQSGHLPVLGFAGHRSMVGLGLMDMKARTYSTAWGQFIEPERDDDPRTWNQFAYSLGNPMEFVDSSGRSPEPWYLVPHAWGTGPVSIIKLLVQKILNEPVGRPASKYNQSVGHGVFIQNRVLGGRLPVQGILSHTFAFTTDANGSLQHTFSWGNEGLRGSWVMDAINDRWAAATAIYEGSGYKRVGGPELIPFLHLEFDVLRSISSENHYNYLIINNCKAEANLMVSGAIRIMMNESFRVDH
ncbi:MAG TPA: RHS repeat-associated core domain-containing protein [Holophaga sp.]|nr:RHS repeat-associated core domain-containing protein [Holophaga sp.]